MSRRYTFSRTIETPDGKETFTAEQFDSFDEARNAVEKGVRDRRLQFPQGAAIAGPAIGVDKALEGAEKTVIAGPQSTPTGSTTAPKTN